MVWFPLTLLVGCLLAPICAVPVCSDSVCFFVAGSCDSPASIHSASQNALAIASVTSSGVDSVALGGYALCVSDCAVYWFDESAADYVPFTPKSTGLVVLNSDGSWAVVPFDPLPWSLCSSAMPASTMPTTPPSTSQQTTTTPPSTIPLATTRTPTTTAPLSTTATQVPTSTTSTSNASTTVAPRPTTTEGNASATQSANTTTTPLTTTFAPNATTLAPNATTLAPNATTLAPNATTLAPNATTLAPNATTLAPNATTLAPNATTLAPNATTLAPNVTILPLPTTAPPTVDIGSFVSKISSLFQMSVITVTEYTANSVALFVASDIGDALTVFEALQTGYLLAVVVGCETNASGFVSALGFDPVTRTATFAVPPAALTSTTSDSLLWTRSYRICVGASGRDGSRFIASTSSTLVVQSLLYTMKSANSSVSLLEEEMIRTGPSLKRILLRPPAGLFQTTRLSSRAAAGFRLAAGVAPRPVQVGEPCSQPVVSLSSFVIGLEMGVALSTEAKALLWSGNGSFLCAVGNDNSTSIVVALVRREPFSASTSSALGLTAGDSTGVVVSLLGCTAAALSSGGFVSAFASSTTACLDVSDFVLSSMVLQPDAGLSSAAAKRVVVLRATTAARVGAVAYACLNLAQNRSVPVVTRGGASLTVSVPTEVASSAVKLVIPPLATGVVNLLDFVRPPGAAWEAMIVSNTISVISASFPIAIVAADISLSDAAKQAICVSTNASTPLPNRNGTVYINATSSFPPQGIVCLSAFTQSYLRIDVVSPRSTLLPLANGAVLFKSTDDMDAITVSPGVVVGSALRLSDGPRGSCTGGGRALVVQNTSVGLPMVTVLGTDVAAAGASPREICYGTRTPTGTDVFAPTGAVVTLTSFASAWAAWGAKIGTQLSWRLTSGGALCGSGVSPFAFPVENGVFLASSDQWPAAFADAQYALSGPSRLQVVMNSGVTAGAVYIEGRMYAVASDLAGLCIPVAPIRLASDQTQFGLTSIATAAHPFLSLTRSSLYIGLVVALIGTNDTCSASGASGIPLIFSELLSAGTAAIDLAPALWASNFQYFSMCASVGASWLAIPDSYILTAFDGGSTASSWLNRVATRNTFDPPNTITLWTSQVVLWTVYGRFSSNTSNVSLILLWDDPTCLSYPMSTGVEVAVQQLNSSCGTVSFSVDNVGGSGRALSLCYRGDQSNLAWPLTLEAIYNRTAIVSPLRVSELQYQSNITLSIVTDDVYIPLTDSLHAPVTYVALYWTNVRDGTETEGCSKTALGFTDFAPVSAPDVFGVRWLVLRKSLLNPNIPAAGLSYFSLCGTAATGAPAFSVFFPLDAFVVLTASASLATTIVSGTYLELAFQNATAIDYRGGSSFNSTNVQAYLKVVLPAVVTNLVVDPTKLLVAFPAVGVVAVWVAPAAVSPPSVAIANAIVKQLFNAVVVNTWPATPLASMGTTWSLVSATGKLAPNSSVTVLGPAFINGVNPSATAGSGIRSFLLFCAFLIPSTIAIVLYALRRKPRGGKAPKSPGAVTELDPSPTKRVTGYSPSPRRPQQQQHDALDSVSPVREQQSSPIGATTGQVPSAHPLYDSDSDLPLGGRTKATAPPSVSVSPTAPPIVAVEKKRSDTGGENTKDSTRTASEVESWPQLMPESMPSVEHLQHSVVDVDEPRSVGSSPPVNASVCTEAPSGAPERHVEAPSEPQPIPAARKDDRDPLVDDDDDDEGAPVSYDL